MTIEATTLTPPEVARRWRVKSDKVVSMIRAGRLPAFDVASPGSSRPRFRIRLADVEAYENKSFTAAPARPRRRRRRTATRKYY